MHIFYSTLRDQSTKSMALDTVLFPGIVIFIACCPPWHCKLDVHKQPKGFEMEAKMLSEIFTKFGFQLIWKSKNIYQCDAEFLRGYYYLLLSLIQFWVTCSDLPGLGFVTPDLTFCLKSYREKLRDLQGQQNLLFPLLSNLRKLV